jgi:hypothetical protein
VEEVGYAVEGGTPRGEANAWFGADIVTAVGKIEAAAAQGYPIASEFHSLNAWR